MGNGTPQIVIGMTNLTTKEESGFEMSDDRLLRIPMPCDCGTNDIEKMKRDCEILSDIFSNKAEEVAELFKQMSEGDFSGAKDTIRALELTEKDFMEKGGGLLWLTIPVVLAIRFWPTKAY